MKHLLFFTLGSLVFSSGLLGCAATPPVPPINLETAPVDVVARYVTVIEPGKGHDHHSGDDTRTVQNEWVFSRTPHRVDVYLPLQATGESWSRDGKALFYEKIFHGDAKVIEYQPEDVSMLAVSVSWQTSQLMVAPHVLAQLHSEGESWDDGHPVRVLKGTVNGVAYDVRWLVDLNLPQTLETATVGGRKEVTRLVQLEAAPIRSTVIPSSAGYEVIDYADLGDRERDPFVMKVQHFLPGGHQHGHE